jgi:tetratricopeptide (TPR) repeat protein
MARMIVQFPEDVVVAVDGSAAGRTNRVIQLEPGQRVVRLEGVASDPAEQTVTVPAGDEILHVGFSPPDRSVDRFSPLYCAYNGFLLGQFLSVAFAEYGRKDYLVRRSRMLEFLSEIPVTVDLPEEPFAIGSAGQIDLLTTVMMQLQAHSRPLAAFTLLGGLMTHYGVLVEADPDTAQAILGAMENVRAELQLPVIEPSRLFVGPDRHLVDKTLSPSLGYLSEIVDGLAVEPDTAFVIMPFSDPYASYFSTFYRPSLAAAGMRAFRAWGGLGSEDYAVLLLKLIEKSGTVWADVSEPNSNVFYEIGAAHAFGKLSMLVANEDLMDRVPANIGHDAVVRYSPTADDWPEGTVRLMSTLNATARAAAESGQRLRMTPDAIKDKLDQISKHLAAVLTPPEAEAAASDAQAKLAERDFAGAARAFDDAIDLGLDDHPTRLGRGMSRLGLARYEDAESDFGAVLDVPSASVELRRAAAQFRGMARELGSDFDGALDDYRLAIELGSQSEDPYLGSARLLVPRGELDAAEGDVLSAEGRFDDAVTAYDRSLAQIENATGEFDRAIALLLGGRTDEAIAGYRRGDAIADADDRQYALTELARRADGNAGASACRQALTD